MDTLFQVSRDEEKEKGKKERNILTCSLLLQFKNPSEISTPCYVFGVRELSPFILVPRASSFPGLQEVLGTRIHLFDPKGGKLGVAMLFKLHG